ncbi:MAG: hypothetical protein QOF66_4663, partial [Mycobacterium sp.]|nr:hypothetical protein [Mycobacterium sp.]
MLDGAMGGRRSTPNTRTGVPLADTIAHPTSGCASSSA